MSKPAGGGLLFKHILTKPNLGDHVEEVTWDILATCLLSSLDLRPASFSKSFRAGCRPCTCCSATTSHLAADLL